MSSRSAMSQSVPRAAPRVLRVVQVDFLYTRSMSGTTDARRIEIATRLFGRAGAPEIPDAPEQFWAPDGTLEDVASGTFVGWPAIRAFFAGGLTRTSNLRLEPDEFWVGDDGLAVHYLMSGDVIRPESYGEEYVGRTVVGAGDVVPAVRR